MRRSLNKPHSDPSISIRSHTAQISEDLSGWALLVAAFIPMLTQLSFEIIFGNALGYYLTPLNYVLSPLLCLYFALLIDKFANRRLNSALVALTALIPTMLIIFARQMLAEEMSVLIRNFFSIFGELFGMHRLESIRSDELLYSLAATPLLSVISSFLLTYLMLYRRSSVFAISIGMGFGTVAFLTDKLSTLGFLLFLASQTAYFAFINISVFVNPADKSTSRSVFSKVRPASIVAILTALIIVITNLATVPFVSESNYTLGQIITDMRKDVLDFFDGDSAHPVRTLEPEEFSNGDFSVIRDRVIRMDEQLMVQAEDLEAMYIKCYTGGFFNGRMWKPLDNSAYDDMLQKYISDIPTLSSVPLTMLWNDSYSYLARNGLMNRNSVTITNLMDRNDCGFMPYCIVAASDSFGNSLSVLLDRDVQLSDSKSYSYTYYDFPESYSYSYYDNYLAANRENDSEAALARAAYTEFVFEHYTALPASSQRIFDYFKEYSELKLDQKLQYVYNYLRSNTRYTLTPEDIPGDEDVAVYFLYESKEGYCMHYATAAAMMLRAMGVPTRFAEGYMIQDRMIKWNSPDEIILTDANRHAWVEVYYENLGWLPVEFTVEYGSNVGTTPKATMSALATLSPTPIPWDTPSPTPTAAVTSPDTSLRPSARPSLTPAPSETPKPFTKPHPDDMDNTTRSLWSLFTEYADGTPAPAWLIALRLSPIILSLLSIIIVLHICLVRRKRIKRFDFRYEGAALNMYSYLLWILKRSNVDCSNTTTPSELISLLPDSHYKTILKSSLSDFNCVYKERFGIQEPSAAELRKLRKLVYRVERTYYRSKKPFKRIVLSVVYGMLPRKYRNED